jgi:hypothetical protein
LNLIHNGFITYPAELLFWKGSMASHQVPQPLLKQKQNVNRQGGIAASPVEK